METKLDPDLAYEVEATLAFYDEDAKAAIAALLCDIKELRRQLKRRAFALPASSPQPNRRAACISPQALLPPPITHAAIAF
ncbi:hypothetical protein [Oryzifoliimicrobium ureilyticus]|uniref:hypothetical protein n=1 Tax=Oryzifoliimicrobium ureilyticus TaxID=3113724 RepID=UPI0030766259